MLARAQRLSICSLVKIFILVLQFGYVLCSISRLALSLESSMGRPMSWAIDDEMSLDQDVIISFHSPVVIVLILCLMYMCTFIATVNAFIGIRFTINKVEA